jgi:hypothetical protein
MSGGADPKPKPQRGLLLLAIYVAFGAGGFVLARLLVRAFRGYPPWIPQVAVVGLLVLVIGAFIVVPRLTRRA